MSNVLRWSMLVVLLCGLSALGIWCANGYDVTIVQKIGSCTFLTRGDIGRTVNLCEAYGVLSMIAIFLVGMAILIPTTRREIPRIVVVVLAAGAITHVVKFLVTRERPHHFLNRIAELNLVAQNESTWHGLLRADLGLFNSVYSSFPSGHTTIAAALTAMLWSMFPQIAARAYFVALLLLLALQRIVSQAHYPSDVLFGAAIGIAVASLRYTTIWERLERFVMRCCCRHSRKGGNPSDTPKADATT
ncbi:MAG: phosphatase PAP2 family protein [Thermoguttaceae bacterium]